VGHSLGRGEGFSTGGGSEEGEQGFDFFSLAGESYDQLALIMAMRSRVTPHHGKHNILMSTWLKEQ
jgi:hypothetical protein